MADLTHQISTYLAERGLSHWLIAVAISFALTALVKIALRVTTQNLKRWVLKTKTRWDDMLVGVLDRTKNWAIFVWILYAQARLFLVNPEHIKVSHDAAVLVTLLQLGIWGYHLLRHWRKEYLDVKASADGSTAAALGLMYALAQAALFVTLFLIGLSNLGVNISALLAGLGVGGIAVALAAQNVLGDLLASLSIVLDKPFVVGDFIVVGPNDLGSVEFIGLKTTRVRALSGEELIFSNKDLLGSRIRNFKSMWRRRVVHNLGVTYSTSAEKLEQIPAWIKAFVAENPKLTFDHCNFISYGNSSLNFEFVFWVTDPDYNLYLKEQQDLLIKIYRKFAAESVEFAFPTQTVIVQQENSPS